jgi:ketosteroid isomerase-like protein
MSQQNVELVMGLGFHGVDALHRVRDDEESAGWIEAHAASFHPDFEAVYPGMIGDGTVHKGLDGLRAATRNWMAPWATYVQEVEEVVDCGERVLVLVNIFARLEESTQDVTMAGAEVWTFRDGKVARWEGFGSHAAGRKALGLEG